MKQNAYGRGEMGRETQRGMEGWGAEEYSSWLGIY
jgi:hypothetical protein